MRVYLILFAAAAVVFLIVVLWPKPKQSTGNIPPSPTFIQPTKFIITPSPLPALIKPAPFTGVLIETLAPAVTSLIEDKRKLRKLTPIDNSFFTVDYDYGEDKFKVVLKDPKEKNLIEFYKWRTINYPAIPLDRFAVK